MNHLGTCPVYDLTLQAASLAGVSHSRAFSLCRTDAVCKVRFAAWHVAREQGWPLTRIAEAAGRKDHGTVINGLDRARQLLVSDPSFSALVADLAPLSKTEY